MPESLNPAVERLVLVDPQSRLCEAWRKEFAEYPAVTVVQGYFEDLENFDCLVSPANSFGIMDGGVDLAISRFFPGIQDRVQELILQKFYGYQPVGTSLMAPTGDPRHPWLAHTPTMRIPMPLSGPLTRQVYESMWAMLCAVAAHNRQGDSAAEIHVVACPGLGTATGGVDPTVAARLMATAYGRHIEPKIVSAWRLLGQQDL